MRWGHPSSSCAWTRSAAATARPEIADFDLAYGRVGAITDDTQMTLFTAEGLIEAMREGSTRPGAGRASGLSALAPHPGRATDRRAGRAPRRRPAGTRVALEPARARQHLPRRAAPQRQPRPRCREQQQRLRRGDASGPGRACRHEVRRPLRARQQARAPHARPPFGIPRCRAPGGHPGGHPRRGGPASSPRPGRRWHGRPPGSRRGGGRASCCQTTGPAMGGARWSRAS